MTPERRAEIRAHVEDARQLTEQPCSMPACPYCERAELLDEVDRLEADLKAIRGWIRSNLQILADAQRDWRQSSENTGKIAVLDDLTRVLDHLDTTPAPDAPAGP